MQDKEIMKKLSSSILKFFSLSCLLISVASLAQAKKFIAFGDPHAGRGPNHKPEYAVYMAGLADTFNALECAFFVGDLTDSGFINVYCETSGIFGSEQPVIDGYGQWGKLCTYWINRLTEKNLEIFLCAGNHDMYYDKDQPLTVADLIKTHYKNLNHISTTTDIAYVVVRDNCHFICLGKYPDNKMRSWLSNYLESVGIAAPIFLFFHYPVIRSRFDFFRNDLYNLIEPYNIKGIFTGHIYSHSAFWRAKEIPVFGVGGHYFALVSYDPYTGDIKYDRTQFHGMPDYTEDVWVTKDFYDDELYLGYMDTNDQIKDSDDDREDDLEAS